ncbi:hypothetical protein LLS47_12215 [Rouxiella badensis]|uniref:hypothetical protein n=1 Tax=Rouxiella badensis TaxID=1646377 RepID=UPI001D1505C5|nr:hypothetical protein [Rouxiella badensis]MCC3733692.1 hypothetical protein [Rouxiella badensis]MCC3759654.1 hypothetical protein [Rouxiella badensis]
MTNKTLIAELRKICEILNDYGYDPDWKGGGVGVHNAAKTIQIIIKQHCESSKMLEAAEARIAGIEKNLDAALYREKRVERQLLAKEAELAAMRGDAEPVAVVEWSDYIVFGQPPRVAVRELSPGALELAMGKSLFTHGQPAPVVVLDDATVLAWGERYDIQGDASKLRCMIEDAASLGLLKSADGEGE